MSRRDRGARGQATVEFALVLPLVLALLLFGVQVGLVIRDQILLVNAAREAARTAAVDADPGAARTAAVNAGALDPTRLVVNVSSSGETVTATVTYRSTTTVPLIGAFVGDLTLTEDATMRRERP